MDSYDFEELSRLRIRNGVSGAGDRRLWVRSGGVEQEVLEFGAGGFAVAAGGTPLRGAVELVEDGRPVARCLIVLSGQDGPVLRYELKRMTPVTDMPALDYARAAEPELLPPDLPEG